MREWTKTRPMHFFRKCFGYILVSVSDQPISSKHKKVNWLHIDSALDVFWFISFPYISFLGKFCHLITFANSLKPDQDLLIWIQTIWHSDSDVPVLFMWRAYFHSSFVFLWCDLLLHGDCHLGLVTCTSESQWPELSKERPKYFSHTDSMTILGICLFWFFTFQLTFFQSCRDGSSWVESVQTDKVSSWRIQHSDSAGGETQPRNPSVLSLMLYQLSHYAPHNLGVSDTLGHC